MSSPHDALGFKPLSAKHPIRTTVAGQSPPLYLRAGLPDSFSSDKVALKQDFGIRFGAMADYWPFSTQYKIRQQLKAVRPQQRDADFVENLVASLSNKKEKPDPLKYAAHVAATIQTYGVISHAEEDFLTRQVASKNFEEYQNLFRTLDTLHNLKLLETLSGPFAEKIAGLPAEEASRIPSAYDSVVMGADLNANISNTNLLLAHFNGDFVTALETFLPIANNIRAKAGNKEGEGILKAALKEPHTLKSVRDKLWLINRLLRECIEEPARLQAQAKLCKTIQEPETLTNLSNLVKNFSDGGGDPVFFADFLLTRPELLALPEEKLQKIFGPIGEMVRQLPQPEGARQFEKSMDFLWKCVSPESLKYALLEEEMELLTDLDGFLSATETLTRLWLDNPKFLQESSLLENKPFWSNMIRTSTTPEGRAGILGSIGKMVALKKADEPAYNRLVSHFEDANLFIKSVNWLMDGFSNAKERSAVSALLTGSPVTRTLPAQALMEMYQGLETSLPQYPEKQYLQANQLLLGHGQIEATKLPKLVPAIEALCKLEKEHPQSLDFLTVDPKAENISATGRKTLADHVMPRVVNLETRAEALEEITAWSRLESRNTAAASEMRQSFPHPLQLLTAAKGLNRVLDSEKPIENLHAMVGSLGLLNPAPETLASHIQSLQKGLESCKDDKQRYLFKSAFEFLMIQANRIRPGEDNVTEVLRSSDLFAKYAMESPELAKKLPDILKGKLNKYLAEKALFSDNPERILKKLAYLTNLDAPLYTALTKKITKPQSLFLAVKLLEEYAKNPADIPFIVDCLLLPAEGKMPLVSYYFKGLPEILTKYPDETARKAILENARALLKTEAIGTYGVELFPAADVLYQLGWTSNTSRKAMSENVVMETALPQILNPTTRETAQQEYADLAVFLSAVPEAAQGITDHLKKPELILKASQAFKPFLASADAVKFAAEWMVSKNGFKKMTPETMLANSSKLTELVTQYLPELGPEVLTRILDEYWGKPDKEPVSGYWDTVAHMASVLAENPQFKEDFGAIKTVWGGLHEYAENPDSVKTMAHLLKSKTEPKAPETLPQLVKEIFASAGKNFNLKRASLQILAKLDDMELAITALDILRRFSQHGGNPLYLAEFMVSRPELKKLSGEKFHRLFAGVTQLAEKYQAPEQRNAMRRSLELLWEKARKTESFMPAVDRMTRMMLSLPFSLSRDEQWTFLQEKLEPSIPDTEVDLYAAQLKTIFAGDDSAITRTVAETYLKNKRNYEWTMHVKDTLEKFKAIGVTDVSQISSLTGNYDEDSPVLHKVSEMAKQPTTNPKLQEANLYVLSQMKNSKAQTLIPAYLDFFRRYAETGGNPKELADYLMSRKSGNEYPSREYLEHFADGFIKLARQQKTSREFSILETALKTFWRHTEDSRDVLEKIDYSTRLLASLPDSISNDLKWQYINTMQQQAKATDLMEEHLEAINNFGTIEKLKARDALNTLFTVYQRSQLMSQTLPILLQSVGNYAKNGGDPAFIIDLLTTDKSGKNFMTKEQFQTLVLPLGDVVKQYETPEKQAVLEQGILQLIRNREVANAKFPETLNWACQMAMEISPAVPQDARWKFIVSQCERISNPLDLAEQSRLVKDIFAGLEEDPQLALKAFDLLKANQNLDLTRVNKELSQHYKALNLNPTEYENFFGAVSKTLNGNASLTAETARKMWTTVLGHAAKSREPEKVIKDIIEIWSLFDRDGLRDYRTLVIDLLGPVHEKRVELALAMQYMLSHKMIPADILKDPQKLRDNLQLIAHMSQPAVFMNEYMLNQDKIHPSTLNAMFSYMEASNLDKNPATTIIPELMAILGTYVESLQGVSGVKVNEYTVQAIKGLNKTTRLQLSNFEPTAFNNYVRIGTLGLSFGKWKFDSMKLWRDQGEKEKPSIFEMSKAYSKNTRRIDDGNFHGGFHTYNPETGVSVEMRRAYVVISKEGLGTLVIRNSGPVFGRDKLEDPAYYHPKRTYTGGGDMFYPAEDLVEAYQGESFQSVFSKKFHDRATQNNIKELLDEFDKSLIAFQNWKSGFKDGKPSEGFQVMMNASRMSAKNNGQDSPFGKQANINLAWINRYGLPYPTRVFDAKDPQNQAEMEFYDQVLNHEVTVNDPKEYQAKMPNLLAFLSYGMEKQQELILSE